MQWVPICDGDCFPSGDPSACMLSFHTQKKSIELYKNWDVNCKQTNKLNLSKKGRIKFITSGQIPFSHKDNSNGIVMYIGTR